MTSYRLILVVSLGSLGGSIVILASLPFSAVRLLFWFSRRLGGSIIAPLGGSVWRDKAKGSVP